MKLSKDGWGGLAVLAASLFLFALTLGLRDNPLVPIGPGYYPRIVLAVTIAFAIALVVMDLLNPQPAKAGDRLNYVLVIEMFALFGLYVGTLPYIGFRLSTFLYVTAANALLDVPNGAKGWARALLIGFITTLVVYYVFERYLTVLMPRGRWTNF